MKNDLLLLSNSRLYGHGYLEHVWDVLAEFVRGRHTIHFVPYALRDRDSYTSNIQMALQPLGVEVIGLHTARDPRSEVEEAEVLFVGGGNSFRLVKTLQELDLLEPVRRRVQQGDLSYIGSSAGTNMACPTMRTTNDMPIVQPPSFESFGLIPFQINPHYADADPNSTHMGETRGRQDQRVPGGKRRACAGVTRGGVAAQARWRVEAWREHRSGSVPTRGGPRISR